MANYALGVVGAVVGAPFGLSALGFSLGFALGSALDPAEGPHVTGPGLSDLSIQGSAEGGMLPIVWGCVRTSGNIVWKTDLKEVVTTKSVGGKGAPPGQSVDEKTYFATLLISVCETPGYISRIWADEKVVYDARSSFTLSETPTSDEILAAAAANKTQANNDSVIQFMTGLESQQPSSVIEQFEGVGNVPAYRGQVTVLFNDFPVADYGNRVPNFSFEVCRCCFDSEVEIIGPTNNMLLVDESFEFTHTGSELCPSIWKVIGGPNDGLTHEGDTFIVTASPDQTGTCENNFIVDLNDGCAVLPIGVNTDNAFGAVAAVRSPRWFLNGGVAGGEADDSNQGCFLQNTSYLLQTCDGTLSIHGDQQTSQSNIGCMGQKGVPFQVGPNGCSGSCITPPCNIVPPSCLGIGRWFQCGRYGFWPYGGGYVSDIATTPEANIVKGWFPGVWADIRGDRTDIRAGNCCPPFLSMTIDDSIPFDDLSRRGDEFWNKFPTDPNGKEFPQIKAQSFDNAPPGQIAGPMLLGDEPIGVMDICCAFDLGTSLCPNGNADCPECFPAEFP